jgi:ribA/ribD-fused uncharacterized protein
MTKILFYRTGDPYGELSNFAAFPIHVDGQHWHTSEHFFQAQKFTREEDREEIRQTLSPMAAAKIGRDRSRPIRPDWDSVKDDVMLAALRAKFRQHDSLRDLLLATDDAELVEHTRNDSYWPTVAMGRERTCSGSCSCWFARS